MRFAPRLHLRLLRRFKMLLVADELLGSIYRIKQASIGRAYKVCFAPGGLQGNLANRAHALARALCRFAALVRDAVGLLGAGSGACRLRDDLMHLL